MGVGTALVVTAAVSGIVKGSKALIAKKKAKEEATKQEQLVRDKKSQLAHLEANQQEIKNPYADMTNEFENLGVATGAAEFQSEQADIALANTLDTMMASGAGAGGATALAQAALQSKKGVSASLQQQEASNQKMRAQGAQDVAQLKGRGEVTKMTMTENRENKKLDQVYGEMENAQLAENDAKRAIAEANNELIDAGGDIVTSMIPGDMGTIGDAAGSMFATNPA